MPTPVLANIQIPNRASYTCPYRRQTKVVGLYFNSPLQRNEFEFF